MSQAGELTKLRRVAIVNPNSANGKTGKIWPDVEARLRGRLGAFDTWMTKEPRHATRLCRQALLEGYDEVLSVGGDGTNNEVVNGFFDKGEPIKPEAILCVVPSGTGGDFRKTLGLAKAPDEVLVMIERGQIVDADVGYLRCQGFDGEDFETCFINITSFGIGGVVDEAVNRTTKAFGGKASFMIGSMRAFASYSSQPMRVEVDGELVHDGPVFNAAVCNGQYHGGGMWVAPMADPCDGLLDLVIVGDISTLGFMALSRKIYDGTHLKHKKVTHFRGKHIRATTSGDALVDMDGETPGRLPIELGLYPASIRLRSMMPFSDKT
jgi:YegS/Rv2252/BmrU family lipid kinase